MALAVLAAAQDGDALFQKHCSMCHRQGDVNRAPLPEAMAALSPEAVLQSLESGTMRQQGSVLSPAERQTVAKFLGKGAAMKVQAPAGMCGPGIAPRTDSSFWNGWAVDVRNTGFQPAKMAGLVAGDLSKLKLKWAFGFPSANAAIAQPTVVGGRVYFGSQDGTVYSVDASTGCIYWTFKAEAMVRTAMSVGAIQGKYAVMFGDAKKFVYAVYTQSANVVWKTKVDEHAWARLTGAPKLHEGRLYVPVSSNEEVPAGNPKYPCCTSRGSIVALDAESGKILWKTYAIREESKPTRKNAEGAQMHGPSGAAIWSSPALDLEKRMLYAATGNGYTDPSVDTIDAILAMSMDTGEMKWHRQLLAGDNWTFACMSPNRASCPEKSGPDHDIGASPILVKLPDGKRLILVGQKSGVVHAIDPDQEGKIVWQTRVGKGSALGGVQWGMAADEKAVYVPVSDVLTSEPGGLYALQLGTGEKLWHAPPVPPTCKGTRGCSSAQMAPATMIPGIVFSGAMDGRLRAYSAEDGKIVWEVDTFREFETVNGVKAKGGSISATGAVVVAKMLFVNSGYAVLGGMAGNVLLAFGLE